MWGVWGVGGVAAAGVGLAKGVKRCGVGGARRFFIHTAALGPALGPLGRDRCGIVAYPMSQSPPSSVANPSKTPDAFNTRILGLKADLVAQSRRVQALIEAACDSAFASDAAAARVAIDLDEAVDRVDVDIEKACVQLLTDATAVTAALRPEQLRTVLTIVKINNELERIADVGVAIGELTGQIVKLGMKLPETIRVITNSVIGILRDVGTAFEKDDATLARIVLSSEDAVEQFKKAIIRDAQMQVASGGLAVDQAFTLQELGTLCEIMSAHCTNIAEQVLYSTSGTIVRHMGGHWEVVGGGGGKA